MRKTLIIAIAAAAALAIAAVAMAAVYTASGRHRDDRHVLDRQGLEVSSASCTGGDGKAFTVTLGHYTGTATSPLRRRTLERPANDHARTTYSTTDGLGWVEGSFRVKNNRHDPNRLNGRFTGTLKGKPARRLPDRLVAWPSRPRARQPECDVRPGHRLHRWDDRRRRLARRARRGRRSDLPEAEAGSEAEARPARAACTVRSRPSVTARLAARSRSLEGALDGHLHP